MLVVANHPNALIDPLVIFRVSGRVVRPLAKAPLFEQAFVGTMLRGLGGLPVYRKQDDPALMHLNERTFDAAIGALTQRDAVQIFPEGQSHSHPSMTPLRTGAARIALMAEERSGWQLGLVIVPIGLTYVRKHRFRGKAHAKVGPAFPVAGYRELYAADPQEAARRLTDDITHRLEAVTLNVPTDADKELLEVAERLYSREKGWTRPREREPMAERLPRLQTFARGLAWLRSNDPDRYRALAHDVHRYQRMLGLFGVREGDLPPRYDVAAVSRYVAREGGRLVLLGIPAAVGMVAWGIPYMIPRLVTRAIRPELDAIATYRLGAALLAFPLMWSLWVGLAFWARGLTGAAAAAILLPLAGLAAILFMDGWRRVSEDQRIFFRAVRKEKARERLNEVRAELARHFDAVAQEIAEPAVR